MAKCMRIEIADSTTQSQALLGVIDEINFFVVMNRDPKQPPWDYWLGNSQDGSIWAMFAADPADETVDCEEMDFEKYLVAWLSDPPQRLPETIGQILYDVHIAHLSGKGNSDELLKLIVDANPFPIYRALSEHMPNPPEEWKDLPIKIEVRIGLSEGAGVNRSTYEEYSVDTLQEAVQRVSSPRIHGILLIYEIFAVGAISLAPYEVDWPLSRRGKDLPYKREKVQGTLPWEYKSSNRLFSIYQHVKKVGASWSYAYYDEPVVRLSVAGKNPDSTIQNWNKVAKYFRSLRSKM